MRGPVFLSFGVCVVFGALAACGTSGGTDGNTPAGSDGDGGGNPASADGAVDNASNDGAPSGDAQGALGADAGTVTRTIDKRPYRVVVPQGYSPSKPTPMLLLLHGYSETSTSIDKYFGTTALAESKGFLLVLPEGNTDATGLQYWNADDACCDIYGKKPDDVGYLHDVINDVKSAYNVDAKRVYAAGHSNGAFMSHRMACDHAEEIVGIVALSGMLWNDASQCNPSAPVAVLQVHGTLDTVVSYNGGINYGHVYPSAPTTVATWASKNGCDATLTDTNKPLDLDTALPGSETKVESHACQKGAAELWSVQGANHFPTFGASWAPTFYGFLEAHPRP